MNWIDVLYVLVAGMIVWVEWDRGVGMIVGDLLSWIVGLWLGVRISQWLAVEIAWRSGMPENIVLAGVFFLVTVLLIFVFQKTTTILINKIQNQYLSVGWQKILGGLLALIYAASVLVFVTFLMDQLYF